jgi:hypothetical protein
MVDYRFDKESGIIKVLIDGIVEIQEIVEYINQIGNDPSLPDNLKIFTDARSAFINFSPKSLHLLIDAINDARIKHSTIHEAILQNNPDITAYSFIYQNMLTSRKNHIFKIFSTQLAALQWLSDN